MELEKWEPHIVITLSYLGMALFIVVLRSVVASEEISGTVLVIYQHIVSTIFLFTVAFFLERGKRPPFNIQIVCWSFFLGFLRTTLGQLLLTLSLQYVSATFQSVALNATPALVFVLAVALKRERFEFCDLYGQAKLWGVVASTTGATFMVLSAGGGDSGSGGAGGVRLIGYIMVGVSIVASALANILIERVVIKYPAHTTLTAMMNFSGAIQTGIYGAITERNTSVWKIRFSGSFELFIILYGGIVMTGLVFWAMNWCLQKRGPVFTTAFSPVLIFFTFLLEPLFLGSAAQLRSIVGAFLVMGGLYLLLWAKANENNGADMPPMEPLGSSDMEEPFLLHKA